MCHRRESGREEEKGFGKFSAAFPPFARRLFVLQLSGCCCVYIIIFTRIFSLLFLHCVCGAFLQNENLSFGIFSSNFCLLFR